MQQAAIQQWLRRKAASETAAGALFTAGCLIFGGVVLVITFLFTYAVVWFGFNIGVSGFSGLIFDRRPRLSHAGIVAVSLTFIGLLFRANQRMSREYLGAYPRRDHPQSLPGLIGLPGALICLLAYPGASTRMIADLLLTGPRLVTIAWSNAGKSSRLARLDVESCSRVLAVLMQRAGRVSFAELTASAGLTNPEKIFRQLRDLDGVVFLREEPIGLSLTGELRRELADSQGQPAAPVSIPAPVERQANLPPGTIPAPVERQANLPPGTICQLLGVPPNASLEEIEVAYRNWMTQSCARQAASLENAAREEQLDEQMQAVRSAYEAFLAKHKPDQVGDDSSGIESVWERFKRPARK